MEWWSDAEGWGALAATDETSGGVFVHFPAIRMDGLRTLRPEPEAEAIVHDREQDGYPYSATVVRPLT